MAPNHRPQVSHRLTGARFVHAVRVFASSRVGRQARWMFAALIAFLFAINGMNVVNSYVGRDFMTAIADRDQGAFIHQAMLYLANGTYYRLEVSSGLANPDQRITEDVRAFAGLESAGQSGPPPRRRSHVRRRTPLSAARHTEVCIAPGRPGRRGHGPTSGGLLKDWNLDSVLTRAEGLDRAQEWPSLLSLGEQQQLACLRVLLAAPGLVILDRPGTALGRERTETILGRFADADWGWTVAPPVGDRQA